MTSVVYLIHFHGGIGHAAPPPTGRFQRATHYLGSTSNLPARLADHAAGRGARIMAAVSERGVPWELVRCWEGGRLVERRLKRWHAHRDLCPLCNPRRRRNRSRRRFRFEPGVASC